MKTFKILTSYENGASQPWSMVAVSEAGQIIASASSTNLKDAQLKIELLLIEFGCEVYKIESESLAQLIDSLGL